MSVTSDKVQNLLSGSEIKGDLKFPLEGYDLESGDMWLILTEYEYMRPDVNASFNPNRTGNSIRLPVPANLQVGYNANWNSNYNLNAWGNTLANRDNQDFAADAIKQSAEGASKVFSQMGVGDFRNGVNSIVETVKGVGGSVSKISGLGSAIATDVMTNNRLFDTVGISQGIARNPFTAALFEGVNFRQFNFNYRLVPKSLEEANAIRSIIKMLKFGMHPSFLNSGAGITLQNGLFRYPNIYKPEFSNKQYLYDMGMCAITGLNVDYHSEGGPYYFSNDRNKIPAFVTLSLSMTEIEVVTKEKISEHSDNLLTGGSSVGL